MKNKILLISGKRSAGKSTLTDNLLSNAFLKEKYFIYSYAFALYPKQIISNLFNISLETLENAKDTYIQHYGIVNPLTGKVIDTVRELLKVFCEDVFCKMDLYIWAKQVSRQIKVVESFPPLEFRTLNNYPTGFLHIISDLRKPTELELIKSDFEETCDIKTLRLNKVTYKNDKHVSEVGLDGFDKFDCYINNLELSPELCYLRTIEQLRNWQWIN